VTRQGVDIKWRKESLVVAKCFVIPIWAVCMIITQLVVMHTRTTLALILEHVARALGTLLLILTVHAVIFTITDQNVGNSTTIFTAVQAHRDVTF
jgi:hypothetical protein